MAVVPICYHLHCKDQTLLISNGGKKNDGLSWSSIVNRVALDCDGLAVQNSCRWMDVLKELKHTRNSTPLPLHTTSLPSIHNIQKSSCNSSFSSDGSLEIKRKIELSSTKKQLRSLDSYFRKLSNNVNQLKLLSSRTELPDKPWKSSAEKDLAILNDFLGNLNEGQAAFFGLSKAEKGLESLDGYLGKVDEDANSIDYAASALDADITETSNHTLKQGSVHGSEKLKKYLGLVNGGGPESSYNDTSSLYPIGILCSINIAVFLFETATPVKSSDLELFSLPSLYGAKINDLILIGEWWRLVTPMFLHWGIHHIALSCWMLFTFGPQVCRTYGSFTFILLYVLGGLSGNFTSFFHIADPTVGGTGPAFAILGAWFICQLLNQNALSKDNSKSMIQKAIIATALSCILSNFGPIDDWTHLGATFTGIAYGYLTSPGLQMKNASSKNGEDGIAVVRRNVGPCRSLLFFSLFILVLCSLLLVVEPPPSSVAFL
ncbi:hypothetical protein AgCh_011745 [Apium graveolens]